MNIDWENIEIFIKPGPTDMRKHSKSLAVYVAETVKGNPLSGNLYVFCGRGRRLIKVLYWNATGSACGRSALRKTISPGPEMRATRGKSAGNSL